jgi:hypothetical protein
MFKFGQKILRAMFGLDLRSLALLRMGLALCLLANFYGYACELRAFLTDDGILPRYVLLALPQFPVEWSVHVVGGGAWFAGGLLGGQAAVAVALLVGWRTRAVTVVSFLLLCSLQARNPVVLYGADQMLRLGLFWAIFLPLGRRFSLDAAAGRGRATEDEAEQSWLGAAGMAYFAQFAAIYIFNGLMKYGPSWQSDYTAVYYSLQLEMFAQPFGQWLKQFDGLTTALTYLVLKLEIYGPLLFVLPVWNARARILGFILFLGLQIGFGVSMQLGLFGTVMVALMLAFLPAEFWTGCAEPLGLKLAKAWRRARDAHGATSATFAPEIAAQRVAALPLPSLWECWPGVGRTLRGVRDGGLLLVLGLVVGDNAERLPTHPYRVPLVGKSLVWHLGLSQRFDMFAPDPILEDGWYVMPAVLRNGHTVDLFSGVAPATRDKPVAVADSYRNQRWRSLLMCLWYPDYTDYLEPFAQYLAYEWNRTHREEERVQQVEIIFMSERSGPNHTKEPVEERPLWTEWF